MNRTGGHNSRGRFLAFSHETEKWYELIEMLSVLNSDDGRSSWWYRVDVWSRLDARREDQFEFTQNHEITPSELRTKITRWESQRRRTLNL